MTARTLTMAELPGLVGSEIGTSDWIEVSQKRIDQFAEATDDHQWIHVDPERAAEGPFGGAIAHGFLTLSLFIPLWSSLLHVSDATTLVNYGLDKVRFTSPVRAGSRVRLTATIQSVEEVPRGGYQMGVSGIIEIEGQERPAVVIEFISRVS
ncbi:MAG: MaoC family dehydratase [Pseudolysinimonas sp.]